MSAPKPSHILADLSNFVKGRRVTDNANILFRFLKGATGILWLSQIASGKKNGLNLRIYGSKAGIEWFQENPNYLKFSIPGKHTIIKGKEDLNSFPHLEKLTKTPPGHPDGFIEAFSKHLICNQMMAKAVIPGMKSEGYGRIINIISTSVKQPIPNLGVSNTIRASVANWAKTLSQEAFSHSVYNMRFLKPVDKEILHEIFSKFKKIFVIEDHINMGALGSIIKEFAWENKKDNEIIFINLRESFFRPGNFSDALQNTELAAGKIYGKITNS